MFKDREDAGHQIAEAIKEYPMDNPLLLGIPRGGVPVAAVAAGDLGIHFSILISRKLPNPFNTESGFGAIAEDGTAVILEYATSGISEKEIERIRKEQLKEIERRIDVLRNGNPLPELKGRTVILTDDGIAMGSTMMASLKMCRNCKAGEIVVAVPVCSPRVRENIENLADRVMVLESPGNFRAVAQVYQKWYDLSDKDVKEILYTYSKIQEETA